LAFLFVLFAPLVRAADYDAYTYWLTPTLQADGRYWIKKTVAWAPTAGAQGYEIYVWRLEDGVRLLVGRMTTEPKLEITWRTRGHYIFYIRSYVTKADGSKEFGVWCNSLDPAVGIVNGQPKAWVVYVNS
jgi:hypothetical protein